MLYLIHILAGAVIAKYFPHILPVIILSLISHFILDIIPHKDNLMKEKITKYNYYIKIPRKLIIFQLVEILLTIIVLLWLIWKIPIYLLATSIFFSLLQDMIKIFYITDLKHNKYFKKYIIFHSVIQAETGWFFGILTQIIVAIIFIIILF